MSQIEQSFRQYLGKHPEIRSAYAQNLLNIRALARAFMNEEGLRDRNIEAVVATIRRFDIEPLLTHTDNKIFSDIKISTKDEIVILDYEKSKPIVEKVKAIVDSIDYNKNETLKVVVGSGSVKVIVDSSNSSSVKQALGRDKLIKERKKISELSLLFPTKAHEVRGIIAYVTSELLLGGINIRELVTCTPELVLYIDEEQSLKAYGILKKVKRGK